MLKWFIVRIRTWLRINGQIYPFAFRRSLGQRPRELLQAKGYIWPYISRLVLIRIQYNVQCYAFFLSRHLKTKKSHNDLIYSNGLPLFLQTLNSISAEKNSTVIFPLPIDLIGHLLGNNVRHSYIYKQTNFFFFQFFYSSPGGKHRSPRALYS